MTVNEKLRKIVDERGIKQSHICAETGLSPDAVSRILNSNRKITADEFLTICDALNVDPRSFFAKPA